MDWIQTNLSHDDLLNSAESGPICLEPYQVPPIQAMDDPDCELVTIMAPPQTGKSAPWQFALVAHTAQYGGPKLIVYQTEDDSLDTAEDVLSPLFRSIPKYAAEAPRQGVIRKDSYHWHNSTIYMAGAGTPVISKPCQWVIADEVDYWPQSSKDAARDKDRSELNNLANLDDRTRTYRNRGRKRIAVCTPSTSSGMIFRQFQDGSREFWHLRCPSCKSLVPSHAFECLNWSKDGDDNPVEKSIRWVCPECKKRHTEARAYDLASRGEYRAKTVGRGRHRSFTWSALACPRAIGWLEIAQAITVAGRFPSRQNKIELWSKYKGLAIPKELAKDDVSREALRGRFKDKLADTVPEALAFCLVTVDTQKDHFYWICRGYQDDGQSYLLGYGKSDDLGGIDDTWDQDWPAGKAVMCLVDEGGHRKQEVADWAKGRPMVYRYKGDNRKLRFPWADRLGFAATDSGGENRKLILVREILYQSDCLSAIYDREPYWWLPADISDGYLRTLLEVKPPKDERLLDDYTRWVASPRAHYFDCEKQAMVALDFLAWKGRKETFPAGKFPAFLQDRWKLLSGRGN